MGDLSDNYPGVAGIGPKTAVDLLTKYQTLNNIYSHLSNLSDLVRQKLINDRDSAYLSRKLATLVDNIPLKLKLSSARLGPKQIAGLESLFKSYNFKSLLSRLQRKHFPKSAKLLTDSQQKTLF
jgi:DNA polymerase-1